jgi:protein-tyrosine-phosphatase
MALGTPVVATAVGGVPEVIAHQASGLLVDGGDVAGLAEACRELIQDTVGARRLAARARRVVQDAFSRERNGLELMNAYRAAVREPRTSGLRHLRSRVARLVHRARAAREATITFTQRRRMDRIRRDPRELVAALRTARRVLMVCHGNIIRSPFAARLVSQALDEADGKRRVTISSAGLAATAGTKSPPAAMAVAARCRVDLTDHVARRLTREAVAASDVIFVMEVAQLQEIQRCFPEAGGKAFLLSCLAPDWPLEVRDPFAQDESVFHASFEHIAASIAPIVRLLPVGAEAR